MTGPSLPLTVDANNASIARLYNFYLGGGHYYDIDEIVGNQVIQRCPFIRDIAADNRLFHQRVVRFLLSQGVRQFLDVGSGIPAWENTHDIVRSTSRDASVLYFDISPEACVVTTELIEGDRRAAVVNSDFREPDSILETAETRRLIDFDQPVAILGISLLPFIPDAERPHELVAHYMDRLGPDSYLALTHACIDQSPPDIRRQVAGIAEVYQLAGLSATLRTMMEFERFFTGLQLVDPIAFACDWRPSRMRPDGYPARECNYAAVGFKPQEGAV